MFSDIRPVFSVGSELGLDGAVIVHVLKINYRQGDEEKDFFVALDSSDLEQFREQLDRAIEKTTFIRSILQKAAVPYLDIT